ncbi:MAG TPA: nitroreductase family deazaflavin-dependent oxidoreductase, partial [Lapillicoccus sp.]
RVSIGRRRRIPAEARLMTGEECADALGRYQHEDPRAWNQLRHAIERTVQRPVDQLPLVELTLRPSGPMVG